LFLVGKPLFLITSLIGVQNTRIFVEAAFTFTTSETLEKCAIFAEELLAIRENQEISLSENYHGKIEKSKSSELKKNHLKN